MPRFYSWRRKLVQFSIPQPNNSNNNYHCYWTYQPKYSFFADCSPYRPNCDCYEGTCNINMLFRVKYDSPHCYHQIYFYFLYYVIFSNLPPIITSFLFILIFPFAYLLVFPILCRQIMEKLSHTIRIESEMGVGTKVYLGLDTVSL